MTAMQLTWRQSLGRPCWDLLRLVRVATANSQPPRPTRVEIAGNRSSGQAGPGCGWMIEASQPMAHWGAIWGEMSTREPATEYRIHHRNCSKQNLTTAVGMRWAWTWAWGIRTRRVGGQRSAAPGAAPFGPWSCVIGRFPEPSDPAGWMVVCILRAGALVRYHGLDLGFAHTPAAASHLRYGTLLYAR